MRATGVIIAIIASALNLALALLWRGSFMHALNVIALVIYAALPAAFVGVILTVFGWPSSVARRLGGIALGVAFVLGSTVVSLPFGHELLERDIAAAKQHCELLVPRIDAYKLAHGHYPHIIGAVGDVPRPPWLLTRRDYYFSDGQRFHFNFSDPGGMMNGFAYYSDARQWVEWD